MVIKIPTIQDMETKLLQDSVAKDINIPHNVAPKDISQLSNRVLSAQEVRHDVSVIARTLIKIYCGWPFYDEVLKRKVLQFLLNIYDNAHDITANDFCTEISNLIAQIPDKHMSLQFCGKRFYTKLSPARKNVGKNIVDRKEKYRVELRDEIAIIAISTLSGWSEQNCEDFHKEYTNILPKSKAAIIDLRGNGGGSSNPSNPLASYLYGAEPPIAKKIYMRNTDESMMIYNRNWKCTGLGNKRLEKLGDPFIKYQSDGYPEFESMYPGYRKPIYVLTDGETGSGAEMFCTCLKHHPFVKFVGENTSGCEIFGNAYGSVMLPESNIIFCVGMDYRELFQDNFELYGYTPDIKCQEDAFVVALKCLQNELENNKIDTTIKSR